MNYSDFKLHGICPIYDQVVVVRCHLCQLIIKLPHLVEHLQKRHKISNDSNETDEALSELILTEQRLCAALNEEKSSLLAGVKNGKKAGRSKQQPSESNGDGQPVKLGAKSRKSKTAGPKSKIDKNELKKELPTIAAASNINASMPLLSSILDDSLSSLKTSLDLINCPETESLKSNTTESQSAQYPAMTINKNGLTAENHHNHHNHHQTSNIERSTDPSNDQIRYKYVVGKIKTKIKGSTTSPLSSPMKGPTDGQFADSTTDSFSPNNFTASQQLPPKDMNKSQEILKNESLTIELDSPNKPQQISKKSKHKLQQTTRDEKTLFNMSDGAIYPILSQQQQQQQHLYSHQPSIIPHTGISQHSTNPCHDSMVLNQLLNKSSSSDNNNHYHHDSINKLAESHQYDSPFKHDSFDSTSFLQDNGEKMGFNKSDNFSNCVKNNNGSNNLANKTAKAYDPNKHCGVVVEEFDSLNGTKIIREPCTRSLTCKKHSINLRRQVDGRCKSFNELFKEYRDEKLLTNHLVNSTNKSSCDISMSSSPSPMKPSTPSKTMNGSMNTDSSRRSSLTHAAYPNLEMGLNSTAVSGIHAQDLLPELNNQMNSQANHFNQNNNNIHHLMSDMNKPMNGYDLNSYQNIPLPTHSQYHPHHQQQQQQLGQDYYMNNNIPQHYQMQNQLQNPSQSQYPMMHKPHHNQQQQRNDTKTNILDTNTSPSVYQPYFSGSPTQNINKSTKNYNFLSSPCPSSNRPAQQQEQRPLHFDEINQHLNLNYMNKMLVKHHPRPSAVTSYNARLTDSGGGHTLWDRKQDNLRFLLSNAFNQTDNFLNKNLSFTSGMDNNSEANSANIKATPNSNYYNNQTASSEQINKKMNKQDMKQQKRTKSCYNETTPVKNEHSNFSNNNSSGYFNHQDKALTKTKNSTVGSNSKKRSVPTGDMYQNQQQNSKQSNTNGNGSSTNVYGISHLGKSPDQAMVASIDNLTHHNTPAKISKPSIDPSLHDVDYRTEVTGFTTNNDVDYRTEVTGFTTNNDVDYRTELTGFATNRNSKDASNQPKNHHWNQLPYPHINNQMLLNGNGRANNFDSGNNGLDNLLKCPMNQSANNSVLSAANAHNSHQNYIHERGDRKGSSNGSSNGSSLYTNLKNTISAGDQHTNELFPHQTSNNRQVMKSISLSPSSSSSSSASNSSTLANSNNNNNNNNNLLFNSIN